MFIPKKTTVSDRSELGGRTWKVAAGSAKHLLGALVITGAAHAQEAPVTEVAQAAAPAGSTAVEVEEIIVTGSSLKREDDAALPVTVVSKEEMDLRDAGTPVDLLTSLPAVTGVPLNESTQGGAGARGDVAGVAMRGLGTGSTLLLLNGRRIAAHGIASGTNMTVNANTMPARGLERVDVLRDGASSIYGSDAVAGVVNFIVDNKFVGNDIEAQVGITEIGSGADRRITLTHGGYYFDEKLHWITTLDAYDRDPLESSDVGGDSNKLSKAPYGFDSTSGPFFDRNVSSQYPRFTIAGVSGTRYMVPTADGAIVRNTQPDRTDPIEGQAYFDMNEGYSLPSTTRFNWFNQVDYKLNDSVTLFGEGLLYYAKSTMERPPVAYSSTADIPIVISASNPNNPFGSDVTLLNYRFVDNGNERAEVETMAYRLVAGARGNFSDAWNWETAATYSRNGTHDISQNAIRESAMRAAIASGAYNPFGYTFSGTGAGAQPAALDPNDQDVIDTFSQHFRQTGRDILTTVDARVTGELFDTWAGAVQVAAGGEYRFEDYALYRPQFHGMNYENDAGLDPENNDFVQASPVDNIFDDRTVTAGFLETIIPLAAPENELLGLYSLSIGASLRYEHYDDFGSTTNPKFTMDWRPIREVMIRGSYNEGFRAPNLAMMNYSRETVASYADPYRQGLSGGESSPRLQTSGALGELGPETSKGVTAGIVVDIPWVEGLRFSVDYFQIKMDNVIATPNASQIRNDDAALLRAATAAALAAGQSIDQIDLGSGTDSYAGNPNVVRAAVTDADREAFAAYNSNPANANNQLATVGALINTLTPFANADKQEVAGYDFNITYNMPAFDWGKVSFSTDWTYLDKFTQTGGLSGVSSVLLGADGNTRLRGSAALSWSYETWAAGLSAYYIGDYADTSAVFAPTAGDTSVPNYVKTVGGVKYWKVDDNITFNAFVSKTLVSESKLFDGMTVRVGVKNLLNEEPPLSPDIAGYDAEVYNSIAMGRTWTLRLNKSF